MMNKKEVKLFFPKSTQLSAHYFVDMVGRIVGVANTYYKNGQVKVQKIFDNEGQLSSIKKFKSDGVRLSKLTPSTVEETDVTLTSEELEQAIKNYEQARKKALAILLSRKFDISKRATDKSLLKQFKEFEEGRFSF